MSGGKLFLGGISPNTSQEHIQMHFQKYGTIVDSVVMYKDGKHRGFGFVTFEAAESALLALAEEQVIDGRTIDVKQADGMQGKGQGTKQAPSPQMHMPMPFQHFASGGIMGAMPRPTFQVLQARPQQTGGHTGATDKIFVGGLPATSTEQMLVDYFGTYGTIIDCVVMKDRLTQRHKGFGFVQYDNMASVEQVMQDYEKHRIDGKWVETKRATPQDQMAATGGGKGKGGFGKGKLGGGMMGGAPGGKGVGACFNCGEAGHRAMECPLGKGGGGKGGAMAGTMRFQPFYSWTA